MSGSCKPALQKYLEQFAVLALKHTAQYFKCTLHKPQAIKDQNHNDDLWSQQDVKEKYKGAE